MWIETFLRDLAKQECIVKFNLNWCYHVANTVHQSVVPNFMERKVDKKALLYSKYSYLLLHIFGTPKKRQKYPSHSSLHC